MRLREDRRAGYGTTCDDRVQVALCFPSPAEQIAAPLLLLLPPCVRWLLILQRLMIASRAMSEDLHVKGRMKLFHLLSSLQVRQCFRCHDRLAALPSDTSFSIADLCLQTAFCAPYISALKTAALRREREQSALLMRLGRIILKFQY